jgi:hypothetical protein
MSISLKVNRKYKIKGKEYNSIEEMPPDIRNAFEKAMASREGSDHQGSPALVRTKIIFNGTEYDGLEAMPQDVRQLYEKMLRAAETGDVPPDIITEGEIKGILAGPKSSGNIKPNMGNMGTPTKAEPAFS